MPLNQIRKLYISVDARTDGAVSGLIDVQRAADQTSEELKAVNQSNEQLYRRTNALTDSFETLAMATGAVALGMGLAAQKGGRVDQQLAEVKAVSGATANQMDRIRQTSSRLGAELPVTMLDVANAFREMTYAGLDATEAINSARAATYLAVTGGLSMAQASRVTTSTLNAFRMEATKSTAVADSLAQTFASSAVTVQEVGKSLEYASAAANQAGQSVTDTTAAIGTLGDMGIRASKAGTGLQQMFARLADPSHQATQALNELGLSMDDFVDKQGDFKSLADIVEILSDALEGMGNAEKLEYLTSLFRARGSRAVAPLVNNVETLNQKLSKIARANIEGAIDKLDKLGEKAISVRNQKIDELLQSLNLETARMEITPSMNRRDVLKQLQALSDDLNQEELSQVISTSLQVDDRTSTILARDITEGESLDALVNGLNAATTAGDLAMAKMDTVRGKVEYLRGSISSFAYSTYRGFRGPLRGALDILISFADAMNSSAAIAQTFGIALMGILGILSTATLLVGAMAAEMYAMQAAVWASSSGLHSATAAMWLYNAAVSTGQKLQWLMTASTGQLATALWGTITAKYADVVATYSLTGALSVLQGALVSMWTLLGPIGWAVLAVAAAFLAWKTGLLDFLGVEQAFESALSSAWQMLLNFLDPVFAAADALGKMLEPLVYLTGMGIGVALKALVGGFMAVAGVVSDVVNWFMRLPVVGKATLGVLGLLVSGFIPVIGQVMLLVAALEALSIGFNWLVNNAEPALNTLSKWLGLDWDKFEKSINKWMNNSVSRIKELFIFVSDFLEYLDRRLGEAASGIRHFFELVQRMDFEEAANFAVDASFEWVGNIWADFKSWMGENFGDMTTIELSWFTFKVVSPGFAWVFGNIGEWVADQIDQGELTIPKELSFIFKLVAPALSIPGGHLGRWVNDNLPEGPITTDKLLQIAWNLTYLLPAPFATLIHGWAAAKESETDPPTIDELLQVGFSLKFLLPDTIQTLIEGWVVGQEAALDPPSISKMMTVGFNVSFALPAPFDTVARLIDAWLASQRGEIETPTISELLTIGLNVSFVLPGPFDTIGGLLRTWLASERTEGSLVKEVFSGPVNAVEQWASSVASAAKDELTRLKNDFSSWWDDAWEVLTNPSVRYTDDDLREDMADFGSALVPDSVDDLTTELDDYGAKLREKYLGPKAMERQEAVTPGLLSFTSTQLDLGSVVNVDTQALREKFRRIANNIGRDFGNWLENQIPSFDLNMRKRGRKLVKSFSEGVANSGPTLKQGVKNLFASVIPFFPSSDAERGPFSDLTRRGAALVTTFTSGMLSRKTWLRNQTRGVLQAIQNEFGSLSPKQWGASLMQKFSKGILGKRGLLKQSLSEVESTINNALTSMDFSMPSIEIPDMNFPSVSGPDVSPPEDTPDMDPPSVQTPDLPSLPDPPSISAPDMPSLPDPPSLPSPKPVLGSGPMDGKPGKTDASTNIKVDQTVNNEINESNSPEETGNAISDAIDSGQDIAKEIENELSLGLNPGSGGLI